MRSILQVPEPETIPGKSTDAPFRIGVISDTHGVLRNPVFEIFKGVDLILHAGDVGRDVILIELEAIAPVRAVSGNVDGPEMGRRRPLVHLLDTPLGRVAMTHGHFDEATAHAPATLARFFEPSQPDFIVFGHTHVRHLDSSGRTTLFNPGAAGRARGPGGPSVGLIHQTEPGGIPTVEHIEIPEDAR